MEAHHAGLVALGSGLGVAIAGIALAFGSYAADTADGPVRTAQNIQTAGYVLSGIGGGLVVGGGVVTLAAQAQLGGMKSWLPGPW